MTTAVLIPARGGSKGIPLKNIADLGGKPLIMWAIKAALASEPIDMVYVSTDSQEISAAIRRYVQDPKLEIINRSASGARDDAPSEAPLLEFCRTHEYASVIMVQATSPFIISKDLDRAVWMLEHGYDSVVSLTRRHYFPWVQGDHQSVKPVYDMLHRPRRQDWPGILVENGALYASRRERILRSNCRVSGRIGHVVMPEYRSMEIDTPEDLRMAEAIING